MPLASLRRLAVQVVLSAPTRLARDRYANASLILSGALKRRNEIASFDSAFISMGSTGRAKKGRLEGGPDEDIAWAHSVGGT
jgi:hypothetical protein